ncbi:crossover junction endodeoxyribonuclease RuvC [Chroococcus sp. FPU101]|uniref:crossover junction endodeoxyribonuclease RuvC n=1 Tax=Chroococcus sp. FPU101 TaxID=1974212 RepID=UPI001A8D88E6|nr:crossover junction endodeoxyribonuclease RuvC [Chroococcus sp. FPU101]GFE71803.1 putative RuvC-like Holliday junction resolvase [Chroococcus sp. FPU101]
MPNRSPKTDHLNRQVPTWLHMPTKPIRVPIALIEQIESYARMLDKSGLPELETEPKQSQPKGIKTDVMTYFGIKPSISELGWAVIRGSEGQHPCVDGVIQTDSKQAIASRLAEIELDLSLLLKQFQPTRVVLENPFVNLEYKNTTSKTLQCLGVVQATVYRQCGVAPVLLYAATWKSHIDSPKATREDLAFSVRLLFGLDRLSLNASVDAVAIAYAGFCGLGIQ